jgi:hypothetical protein
MLTDTQFCKFLVYVTNISDQCADRYEHIAVEEKTLTFRNAGIAFSLPADS